MSTMSLHALVRKIGPLTLVGAVALTLVTGFGHVNPTGSSVGNIPAVNRLADGSESTGKPPKPHNRSIRNDERIQRLADGSESTGKPPKPKGRSLSIEQAPLLADSGSESTGKPPKPHRA